VVEDVTRRFVDVAPPLMVRPPPSVPAPIVEEADDWKPERMPSEVRDEETTFEANVVPVRFAAGTVPANAPEMVPAVSVPMVAEFALSAVVEARVETKRLVVVAFVPVAFVKVKSCKVDEPLSRRLEKFERPPVAVSVVPTVRDPVRLAADDMVCPLINPEVTVERVAAPRFAFVEKRLVEDAVVEKSCVVVAFVVVLLVAVSV
jgi:hypothetical protein